FLRLENQLADGIYYYTDRHLGEEWAAYKASRKEGEKHRMYEFDFGPISRTVDASTGRGNAINFASLPLHEALTALLASSNRDEFVAWLWHDLFKPLFWWQRNTKRNKFDWIHIPNNRPDDPLNAEARWAAFTGVPSGLVETHHADSGHKFRYGEPETVNNEFDQVAVGREARFLQLSFLAEPATHTALLRAVIADAFMEVVTKAVAASLETELATKSPTFKQIRYVFDFSQVVLSGAPASSDIASLASRYTLDTASDELIVNHLVPLAQPGLDGRHVEVVIDLTAEPPTEERCGKGIISLVELLTVYQDSRTILMGIPQFLQVDVAALEHQVQTAAEQRLRDLDIRVLASIKDLKRQSTTQGRVDWNALPLKRRGQDVDLLAHVFAEQVEIRLIEHGQLTQTVKDVRGKQFRIRFLNEIVSHPIALLAGKPRHCRFCNTAFDSDFPLGEATVGNDFTDVEHVGFGGDICPMCRIYVLNSHKSRTAAEQAQGITGDRKGYRGAFALVAPSSHFTYAEDHCALIERPPLDVGGRFAHPLQRATVTLQEYSLFNMISRRVIARLWTSLNNDNQAQPLPLPYLGAILLTQDKGDQVRALFDRLEALFEPVELVAYPFRIAVQPAVELAFEMAVNDLKQHHTKHTYLKTSPTIVAVDPDSKFTLLVDNGLQLEVSRQFFADRRRVHELLHNIKSQERRRNWLLAVLQGADPVTATVESFYDGENPIGSAERLFWNAHWGAEAFAHQWQKYEEVRQEVQNILSRYPFRYPLLIEILLQTEKEVTQ
ncbi:hypothetical protein, partial [Thermogutta sp.]|uniref:hypothetical protein n=1 Tax=Thermogutta sp. TaxID=1962930 RepID=UPI0032207BCD